MPELGELLLSLNYLPTAGRLSIDVIKAKQLIQTDLVGGSGKHNKAPKRGLNKWHGLLLSALTNMVSYINYSVIHSSTVWFNGVGQIHVNP